MRIIKVRRVDSLETQREKYRGWDIEVNREDNVSGMLAKYKYLWCVYPAIGKATTGQRPQKSFREAFLMARKYIDLTEKKK